MINVLTLLRTTQNVPVGGLLRWTAKQKRGFQRCLSGIKRAQNAGAIIRVITLTSAPGADTSPWGGRILARRWQTLRKRIQKRFGRLEYFRIRTSEGNGVLHIVYRGPYIPHAFLKRNWDEIHGAPIVFIQALYGKSKRIAGYLASHYMSGHNVFTRQSWSWGWCFRGFVKVWYRVRSRAVDLPSAIAEFNMLLRMRDPAAYYKQNRKKKRYRMAASVYQQHLTGAL